MQDEMFKVKVKMSNWFKFQFNLSEDGTAESPLRGARILFQS
jgi:hypothetical protein